MILFYTEYARVMLQISFTLVNVSMLDFSWIFGWWYAVVVIRTRAFLKRSLFSQISMYAQCMPLLKTIAALKLYIVLFKLLDHQKVSSNGNEESVNRGKAHENSWYKKTQIKFVFRIGIFQRKHIARLSQLKIHSAQASQDMLLLFLSQPYIISKEKNDPFRPSGMYFFLSTIECNKKFKTDCMHFD